MPQFALDKSARFHVGATAPIPIITIELLLFTESSTRYSFNWSYDRLTSYEENIGLTRFRQIDNMNALGALFWTGDCVSVCQDVGRAISTESHTFWLKRTLISLFGLHDPSNKEFNFRFTMAFFPLQLFQIGSEVFHVVS